MSQSDVDICICYLFSIFQKKKGYPEDTVSVSVECRQGESKLRFCVVVMVMAVCHVDVDS